MTKLLSLALQTAVIPPIAMQQPEPILLLLNTSKASFVIREVYEHC